MDNPKTINLAMVDRDRSFVDRLSPTSHRIRRCIQCGTCSGSCPTADAMDYTPRQVWRLLQLGFVEQVLDSKTFWLCTVCSACQARCRRGIDIRDEMVALKEWAIREGIHVPERVGALRDTVIDYHNISADDNAGRLVWSDNLEQRPVGVEPLRKTAETVYYVGCVSSFYPRAYSIPRALVQVMDRAGVAFTTLGGEEWCCGYPLYVAGMRDQMVDLVHHNLESVRAVGARRVVFTCPSCVYAWSHLYPDVTSTAGLEFLHATEFLARLLDQNQLVLGPVEEIVTYHDPCDLGRKSGVFDAPREVLAAIPGLELREMSMNRQDALCCGGGGDVETVDPEVPSGVAAKRLAQVEATGAKYVASACQQCERTLQEGARRNRIRIRAIDVVELLWRSIQAAES